MRAASIGDVQEANCHPFHFGNLLLMHNGHISGFRAIKRRLREQLDDEIYNWIEGSTDSEHFFALLLHHLGSSRVQPTLVQMKQALLQTINHIIDLCASTSSQTTQLNLALTDGVCTLATRFAWPEHEVPNTLYTTHGTALRHSKLGEFVPSDAFLVVSERLNRDPSAWNMVPPNHLVTMENGSCTVEPIVID